MALPRGPLRDPRTVARDIPGIFDALFPQLAPGVVMHLNNSAISIDGCEDIPDELIQQSGLQHAMLFELAGARAEQLVRGTVLDWNEALNAAIRRQRKHFDARLPEALTEQDKEIATLVAGNLHLMLNTLADASEIVISPHVPGLQWVASGVGDFSYDSKLVEVKCTGRRFGAADYRQVLMYWLLSYAASIEGRGDEWSEAVLLNPRQNLIVEISFNELIEITGAGRTKVELLQLFLWMVGDYSSRVIDHG